MTIANRENRIDLLRLRRRSRFDQEKSSLFECFTNSTETKNKTRIRMIDIVINIGNFLGESIKRHRRGKVGRPVRWQIAPIQLATGKTIARGKTKTLFESDYVRRSKHSSAATSSISSWLWCTASDSALRSVSYSYAEASGAKRIFGDRFNSNVA